MILVDDHVEAVGERALGERKIDGERVMIEPSWRRCYRTGMSGILPLFASAVLCAAIETCAAVRSATVRNARAAADAGLGDDERHAGVAALANRLIDRQPAEERHAHLRRQRFAAAVAEDVGLVVAVGARVVAHVLDDADRRDIELLIHPHGAPAVGQRHLLRRRHDDRADDRHRLAEAQRDVAGAGRHVDDQVVEVLPRHFAEELLDGAVQHRPAPDDRRIVVGHEPDRDDLHAVLLRRHDLAVRRSSSCALSPSMIGTFGP